METISYPIDAPEFVRATNSAENSNDVSLAICSIEF